MRVPCPGCAAVLRATEKHVGLKNRCLDCGTKFIIPACEEDEIEVLEWGEETEEESAEPTVTKVSLAKPPTKELLTDRIESTTKPKTETPRPPRKLITNQEPLSGGVRPNLPGSRRFSALPGSPPSTPGDPPANTIPIKKAAASQKRERHSLEHIPALDPEGEAEAPAAPDEDRVDPPTTTVIG